MPYGGGDCDKGGYPCNVGESSGSDGDEGGYPCGGGESSSSDDEGWSSLIGEASCSGSSGSGVMVGLNDSSDNCEGAICGIDGV